MRPGTAARSRVPDAVIGCWLLLLMLLLLLLLSGRLIVVLPPAPLSILVVIVVGVAPDKRRLLPAGLGRRGGRKLAAEPPWGRAREPDPIERRRRQLNETKEWRQARLPNDVGGSAVCGR
jgi:hypothetical protein